MGLLKAPFCLGKFRHEITLQFSLSTQADEVTLMNNVVEPGVVCWSLFDSSLDADN